MTPTQIPEHDKDLLVLSVIDANSKVSQREISNTTGLSLGTVNLLIRKMIREGMIKMETIPVNRVVYMLTPKGLVEKAEKTVHYIRRYYSALQDTKTQIRNKLEQHGKDYPQIIVVTPESELKELIDMAIHEYMTEKPQTKVTMVDQVDLDKLDLNQQKTIFLYLPEEHAQTNSFIETTKHETDLLI